MAVNGRQQVAHVRRLPVRFRIALNSEKRLDQRRIHRLDKHGVDLAAIVSAQAKLSQAEREHRASLGAMENVPPGLAGGRPVEAAHAPVSILRGMIEDERKFEPAGEFPEPYCVLFRELKKE